MKRRLWHWGPALLMMALIFLASGTPGEQLPNLGSWDLIGKKGGHMLGYALLAAAYLHGLTLSKKITRGTVLIAILLAGLYAVTDEFHQLFVPERTSSPVDVGIDIVGASLGAPLWTWIRSFLQRRRKGIPFDTTG